MAEFKLQCPMIGKIVKIEKKAGDSVETNEKIVILESMKIEMPVVSPVKGTIKEVKVKEGDTVEADAILAIIET